MPGSSRLVHGSLWWEAIDEFLREGVRGAPWRVLGPMAPLLVVVICGAGYGAAMASYGGLGGGRSWLVLFSTIKVPLLFGCTLLIAVPGFYVLNLLCGVGDHFPRVWRGLVDFQLSVALQLLALTPITLFLDLATGSYAVAQGWSILVFAMVAWNGQISLRRCFRELHPFNRAHRWLGRLWIVLYAFVGVQMAWVLRPFVGHPEMPPQFFRDQIDNAYVEIGRIVWNLLRGLF